MSLHYTTIIDISQPVNSSTACFPGDVPFSKTHTLTTEDTQLLNLSAFTMSPHVGTHADAPLHIAGSYSKSTDTDTMSAANLELSPFLGEVLVIDVSGGNDYREPITAEQIQPYLDKHPTIKRLLLKTLTTSQPERFDEAYASISPELATYLAQQSIVLVGLDTPSVDPIDSKTLDTHHILQKAGLVWLENLDLTHALTCVYTLIALPLNFTELEASPVRAILLKN